MNAKVFTTKCKDWVLGFNYFQRLLVIIESGTHGTLAMKPKGLRYKDLLEIIMIRGKPAMLNNQINGTKMGIKVNSFYQK